LRVVFSQTRKFTPYGNFFTDANRHTTLLTQRNVSNATVSDHTVWLPKLAGVIAAVPLSNALKNAHSKVPSNVHVRAARF